MIDNMSSTHANDFKYKRIIPSKLFLPLSIFMLTFYLNTPLHAKVLGNFTAGTNYVWRGVTQTSDSPAIAAEIEYRATQGSYLGLWTSSVNYGDRPSYEVHSYLGHEFKLSETAIDIALRNYYFPTGGKYNFDFQPEKWKNEESSSFNEIQTGITYLGFNARYSYSNNYLDSDRTGNYIELNYSYNIIDELSFKLHVGRVQSKAIDDTQYTATDKAVSIMWTNFFLTATHMPDNADGRQSDKFRYIFGWNMPIDSF